MLKNSTPDVWLCYKQTNSYFQFIINTAMLWRWTCDGSEPQTASPQTLLGVLCYDRMAPYSKWISITRRRGILELENSLTQNHHSWSQVWWVLTYLTRLPVVGDLLSTTSTLGGSSQEVSPPGSHGLVRTGITRPRIKRFKLSTFRTEERGQIIKCFLL